MAENGNRLCYYSPETDYVEGRGYRVAIVKENEPGYYPTGGAGQAPWYWGHDLKTAQDTAKKLNNDRLGLSDRDVMDIIISSMGAQNIAKRKH